jgi:hypothetical protein
MLFNMLCDHVEKHVFTIKAQNEIKSFRGNSGVLPGSSVGNQFFSLGGVASASQLGFFAHRVRGTSVDRDRMEQ